MKLNQNTILITGGGSGIGLALAQEFSKRGNKIIFCGRSEQKLKEAQLHLPDSNYFVCDLNQANERINLFQKISTQFPQVNVLLNNAGIQNRCPSLLEPQNWENHAAELATNLAAPMHLAMLFISHFKKMPVAAIINVSSGLAFAPLSFMPTYCATKAALHSFTLSLRYQLKNSSIEVIEVAPPAVNTDLGGKGLHDFGVNVNEYAQSVLENLALGKSEFGYQTSEKARLAGRNEIDQIFNFMNQNFSS